jgi:hypothetical protein
MPASAIIDITIGLVLTYLLLSLLCTIVNEIIARVVALRAKTLRRGIGELLQDPNLQGLAKGIYDHGLVKGLAPHGKMPSYMSADIFARCLFDVVTARAGQPGAGTAPTVDDLRAAVGKIENAYVKQALDNLLADAEGSLDKARKHVEHWFDESMQRVTGWYTRNLQTIALIVAAVITVVVNADTLTMGRTLWQDPVLRTAIADSASEMLNACENDGQNLADCKEWQDYKSLSEQIYVLPLGWPTVRDSGLGFFESIGEEFRRNGFFTKIVGWFITALAVSLGAPFWFEILKKLNSIRTSGQPPPSTAKV